jgi:hypothetical protein
MVSNAVHRRYEKQSSDAREREGSAPGPCANLSCPLDDDVVGLLD